MSEPDFSAGTPNLIFRRSGVPHGRSLCRGWERGNAWEPGTRTQQHRHPVPLRRIAYEAASVARREGWWDFASSFPYPVRSAAAGFPLSCASGHLVSLVRARSGQPREHQIGPAHQHVANLDEFLRAFALVPPLDDLTGERGAACGS